jgi:hypothetical protein
LGKIHATSVIATRAFVDIPAATPSRPHAL